MQINQVIQVWISRAILQELLESLYFVPACKAFFVLLSLYVLGSASDDVICAIAISLRTEPMRIHCSTASAKKNVVRKYEGLEDFLPSDDLNWSSSKNLQHCIDLSMRSLKVFKSISFFSDKSLRVDWRRGLL